MKLTILGGGLSAISLACFLQNREDIAEINILEKEDREVMEFLGITAG